MDNHSFQHTSSPEKNSSFENQKESPSTNPTAEKLENGEIAHEVTEMIENAEGEVEAGDGNVNEKSKEGKNKYAGSSGNQSTATKVAKKITPPSLEVMRTQIGVKIKKEIIILEREAAKVSHGSHFNPFQLNDIVAKIRDLKEILACLSYATLETLKNWWFKYVKGITST